MRSVLQNQQRRQLEIVEYLLEHELTTMKQMGEDLFISEKTIRKDAKDLNNFLYPVEIVTTNHGMLLSMPNNYSSDFLYSCFLEQSIEFSIAEDVFFNVDCTVENLAEHYQVSISTIRRSINRLNEEFLKYGFELISNPMKYVGDELQITMFIYTLIKEKYSLRESPFSQDEYFLVRDMIIRFYEDNDTPIDDIEVQRLSYIVLVTIMRKKLGHLSIDDKKVDYMTDINYSIAEDVSFKERVSFVFKLELTENYIRQIFWVISNEYHFLNSNGAPLSDRGYFGQEAITNCSSFLYKLSDELDIPFKDIKVIALEIYNMANLKADIDYILHDPLLQFEKELSVNYTNYNRIFDEVYDEVFTKGTFTFYQKRFMKYQVFTRWNELIKQLKQSYEKPRISIVSNRHYGHALFIQNQLDHIYKSRIEIDILFQKDIPDLIEKDLGYHILVTNIQGIEPKNNLKVINFHMFPTRKDLMNFDMLVQQQKAELKDPLLKKSTK